MTLVFALGTAFAGVPAKDSVAAKKKTYIIVLDPGHDETHTGAMFNGLDEAEITLKLSKYIKRILVDEYDDRVKVYLTRTDMPCKFGGKSISTTECLNQRPLLAKKKKASMFVSIHVNSSTGTVASGVETYSATEYMNTTVGKTSHELAANIQSRLVKLGFTNRGTKYRNWIVIKRANEYNIPAVLVEHGFIRNPSDRRWLSSDAKLKKMAQADADGIALSLGLKKNVDDEDYEEEEEEAEEDEDEDEDYDDDDARLNQTSSGAVVAAVSADGKATVPTTVKLSSIKAVGFAGLQISWQPYANAKGYSIYRRARSGEDKSSEFEKIGTTKDTTFTDNTCQTATIYQYTVRAYGKGFRTGNTKTFLTKTTRTGGIVGFKAAKGTFNAVVLTWNAKPQASGYQILRADVDADDGTTSKYASLAMVTDPKVVAYTDVTAEAGTTYKYRIRAYHTEGSAKQYGSYVTRKLKTATNKVSGLGLAKEDDTSVKLTWQAVSRATGYEVSRAKGVGSTKFTILELVDDGSRTYTDKTVDMTETYRYRVRAYYVKDAVTYWGSYSDTVTLNGSGSSSSAEASTPIAGSAKTTVSQMVAFYKASGRIYPSEVYEDKGASKIDDFAQIVYEEATDEGIRPEVVFAQICKETRYLEFGGDVKAKQCNFAGLGVSSSGKKGETFSNVRQGIRAQVQHLKAYANTEKLVHTKVDPRFDLVKRGSAKYVEWLGIKENPNGSGWASDKNYGYSLKEDFLDVLLKTAEK